MKAERFSRKCLASAGAESEGLDLMQMMDAASDGKFKALWAIGYDMALTNPDANATAQSLKSLEFVVVQDMFLNEIASEFGQCFFRWLRRSSETALS